VVPRQIVAGTGVVGRGGEIVVVTGMVMMAVLVGWPKFWIRPHHCLNHTPLCDVRW